MTLRQINIFVGLTQTILSTLAVIPITVGVIKSGGGGFGFGLMFLPILVPLAFSALFGVFGLVDYQTYYSKTRKFLIGTHILTAIAGVMAFMIMPLFPFLILSIPLAVSLIKSMTKENIGQQLLITNALILLCLIIFLGFWIGASDGGFLEKLTNLWK